MKVSFTGTKNGMTDYQHTRLLEVLSELCLEKGVEEFHHGVCVGADEEAHAVALCFKIPVILHPPIDQKSMAKCLMAKEVREPKPYLVRNRDIVDEGDLLIAAPATKWEVLRSGTWATVRYARKKNKVIIFIWPKDE